MSMTMSLFGHGQTLEKSRHQLGDSSLCLAPGRSVSADREQTRGSLNISNSRNLETFF